MVSFGEEINTTYLSVLGECFHAVAATAILHNELIHFAQLHSHCTLVSILDLIVLRERTTLGFSLALIFSVVLLQLLLPGAIRSLTLHSRG